MSLVLAPAKSPAVLARRLWAPVKDALGAAAWAALVAVLPAELLASTAPLWLAGMAWCEALRSSREGLLPGLPLRVLVFALVFAGMAHVGG